MSTQKLDPLTFNIPIVDDGGRPTPEFMRKWSQQRAVNDSSVTKIYVDTQDATTLKTAEAYTDAHESAGADPTATASDSAVNGSAATFMRSDAAPAIQKCSPSVFGLCKPDGLTVTSSAGVLSAIAGSGGGTFSPYFAGALTKPVAANFTLNKSTNATPSTLADLVTRGIVLAINEGTNATATAEQAALSSSSFTATAFLYAWGKIEAAASWAIYIKDSTGKYAAYGIRSSGTTFASFEKFVYSALSGTITSTSLTGIMNVSAVPIWLRVQCTGGNFIFSTSQDGENWQVIFTEAQSVIGATISTVGIGGIQTGSTATQFLFIDCFSWTHTSP